MLSLIISCFRVTALWRRAWRDTHHCCPRHQLERLDNITPSVGRIPLSGICIPPRLKVDPTRALPSRHHGRPNLDEIADVKWFQKFGALVGGEKSRPPTLAKTKLTGAVGKVAHHCGRGNKLATVMGIARAQPDAERRIGMCHILSIAYCHVLANHSRMGASRGLTPTMIACATSSGGS